LHRRKKKAFSISKLEHRKHNNLNIDTTKFGRKKNCNSQLEQDIHESSKITSLGAIRDDSVMDFSGKGPGLPVGMAMMTTQSPDGTAFTFPRYHPVAPAAVDAIYDLPYPHTNIKIHRVKLFLCIHLTHSQIQKYKIRMH